MLLNLEYFGASRQLTPSFSSFKSILVSIIIMLSVLFAIETCYAIKANNNKKKSRSLRNLEFCWRKFRKDYFASAFSCGGKKAQFSRVDDRQLSRLRKAYANN